MVAAPAERRERDDELVEAVVKVRPEPAGTHLGLQRDLRGRDDSPVQGHQDRPAERLHLALLQDSQKRRLDGEWQIGNLVEEQGTAVSQLEVALSASICARERALLVAEQLGLDQRVGNRTADERDEGDLSPI